MSLHVVLPAHVIRHGAPVLLLRHTTDPRFIGVVCPHVPVEIFGLGPAGAADVAYAFPHLHLVILRIHRLQIGLPFGSLANPRLRLRFDAVEQRMLSTQIPRSPSSSGRRGAVVGFQERIGRICDLDVGELRACVRGQPTVARNQRQRHTNRQPRIYPCPEGQFLWRIELRVITAVQHANGFLLTSAKLLTAYLPAAGSLAGILALA
ncbi:hypothetical protein N657DRAFT_118659 [Parathielavia appendiculata]|uniref:Uncharacterized protein n=1 Tax=Parathielavia appendiculata TaxID=2587402 RepID=A0AAN6Z0Q9_9PEZI|nr:hypothetical protein N657DRAFT_118659 [Parathielavia appendiculata]